MRALFDVNVLIALLDGGHLHHHKATQWLAENARAGWASCPLTQNGCMRIMSLSSYPNSQPVAAVAERLQRAVGDRSHTFWPDDVSMLDTGRVHWNRVLGSRQLTDVYLLALAVEHKARLVTFDHSIPLAAVDAAQSRHLVKLA